MADYRRLRTIFSIDSSVSDDEIKSALEAAGYGKGSSPFWSDSTRDLEGEKWLDRQRALRDRINESINEEIRLEEELQELKRNGASEDEIREKRREIAAQKRETDQLKEAKHQDGVISKISKTVDTIESMVKAIQSINDPWARADEAASKYAKTIGTIGKGMDALRKSTLKNMVHNKIGINYNTSTEELLGLQENYSKAIGRSIRLSNEDQENIAAINFATNGMATELLPDFEKFALGLSSSSEHIGKMFSTATKEGISLEKYTKNVQEGLAMAQTYTFRGGLKSMEAMAKRAASIRMDMHQVSSFADKFSNIEDAIQNSARLQVLGGSFAAGADALGLLSDSLMDMESLEKRLEGFTAGKSTFNRATGEVETSAFNKMRLREYANITGQDFNKVMEVSQRQAMKGEIESQLKTANNSQIDEELKTLILNTATFKDGKAGVSINGEFKTLDQIEKGDKDELIAQTRSESEDIKEIAKDVRSLVDVRKGFGKQKDAVQAAMTAPLAKLEKFLGKALGQSNFFLGVLVALQSVGTISNVFGRGGIGRNGLKNLRKLRGARGGSGGMSSANAIKGLNGPDGLAGTQRIVNLFGKEGATNIIKTSRGIRQAKTLGEGAKALQTGTRAMSGLKLVKSSGIAAGAVEGIVTGIDEFSGNKNYGTGKKIGRTTGAAVGGGLGGWGGAALGAAIGSAILPGIGTAVGALLGGLAGGTAGGAVGKWAGGGFAAQKRREKTKANLGLSEELQGDYTVKEIKEINKARVTGKISKKTLDKLADKGDIAMYQQINELNKQNEANNVKDKAKNIRKSLKEEREEAKKNFGTANIDVTNAYFGGRGVRGISETRKEAKTISRGVRSATLGATIGTMALPGVGTVLGGVLGGVLPKIVGKKETGSSKELSTFERIKQKEEARANEEKNRIPEKQKIDVNITGTIKLETPDGSKMDITKDLKNNQKFISAITELVAKRLNVMNHGAYVEHKQLGNN